MIAFIGSIFLLLVFSAIPYALAVAMPNWRWLLGLTLIATLVLAPEPSMRWMIGDVGPCTIIRFLVVLAGAIGLAVGIVTCALTLVLRAKGIAQRRIVMVRAAGAMIAPAILLAPSLWH